MRVWVDASVLIGLDLAGEVRVLKELLGRASVTPEVAREVRTGRESQALRSAFGDWIEIVRLKGDRRRWEALGLGPGEASLFLTPRPDRLVLDDAPARTVAEAEGRGYAGLPGVVRRHDEVPVRLECGPLRTAGTQVSSRATRPPSRQGLPSVRRSPGRLRSDGFAKPCKQVRHLFFAREPLKVGPVNSVPELDREELGVVEVILLF